MVHEGGRVVGLRPLAGPAESYVLSAGFVNAHSHLEYRGLQGRIDATGYWAWIREVTRAKQEQSPEQVRADCLLAATENRATGVALIAEHSDRPFAAEAIRRTGLRGALWQEVITFFEQADPSAKLAEIEAKARLQANALGRPVALTPHATYTVDRTTLGRWRAGPPFSIHAAETALEREFFAHDTGPVAESFRAYGFAHPGRSRSPIAYLDEVGLLRPGVQIVHACDADEDDLALMRDRGVSVAHCPRSNQALGCPPAPVGLMLDFGIPVGLGLDSAASSGSIDFFAEMRAVQGLEPEVVWRIGTCDGAASLGIKDWDVAPGSTAPLLAIECDEARTVGDLIEAAQPSQVRWLDL